MDELGEDGAGNFTQQSSEAPLAGKEIQERALARTQLLKYSCRSRGEGSMGEGPSWGSSEQLTPADISRALRREQSIVEFSLFWLSLIFAVKVISSFLSSAQALPVKMSKSSRVSQALAGKNSPVLYLFNP